VTVPVYRIDLASARRAAKPSRLRDVLTTLRENGTIRSFEVTSNAVLIEADQRVEILVEIRDQERE